MPTIQEEYMAKSVTRLILGFGLAISVYCSASASPITFTWDPSAVGLTPSTANSQIVANNFNVSDFVDARISSTGVFNERAVLPVINFLDGGSPVTPDGFLSNYNFYLTFNGTGTQGPIPAQGSGLAATGAFKTGSYTFWASPNSNTSVTIHPGGSPTIGNNSGAFALFGGQLINGTVTLTAPSGGGFSPKADINLGVGACTASGQVLASGVTCTGNESAFFVDPLPADLSLLFGDFSANTQVVTLAPGTGGFTNLDINGGGGNLTFATLPVPEPASMLLLSSGLVGLTLLLRRRRVRG